MTCDELRAHSLDLLYDELAPDARANCEAHLSGCAGCRAELDALRGTLQLTRSALQGPLDEPPPRRVRAALREAAEQQLASAAEPDIWARVWHALTRPWLLPVLAGAAALVIAVSRQLAPHPEEMRLLEEPADRAGAPKREQAPLAAAEHEAPADERQVPAASDSARGPAAESELRATLDRPQAKMQVAPRASPPARGPAQAIENHEARLEGASPAAEPAPAPAKETSNDAFAERAKKRSFATPPAAPPPPAALADADDARAERDLLPSPRGSAASGARQRLGRADTANSMSEEAYAAAPAPAPAPAELKAKSAQPEPESVGALQDRTVAPSATGAAEYASQRAAAKPARVQPRDSVLALRIKRADEAFTARRWAEAATAYRSLLRDYPQDRDVRTWKQRLEAAEAALR